MSNVQERLDYLRGEIEAERISYEEIAELQSLAEHIDEEDVVLREWAGIPEHESNGGEVCTGSGAVVRAMPLVFEESVIITRALDLVQKDIHTDPSMKVAIEELKRRLNQTFAGI